MLPDRTIKILLLTIAIFLGVIALRPFFTAAPVHAQGPDAYPFFIEPGYVALRDPDGTRQLMGKMVVDMTNGDIWGFPTMTSSPYPIDSTTATPPVSRPMFLGKFDFTRAHRVALAP
jgi:hypothetical protein